MMSAADDRALTMVRERLRALDRTWSQPLPAVAERLLERIAPPSWTLEWLLPRWIGAPLGLDETTTIDLMLANVLGLGYVRLQDDLADGGVEKAALPATVCLSALLYQEWMALYRRLLAASSPVWTYCARYQSQWIEATLYSNQQPEAAFAADNDNDLLRLAARGAPLKICCAGVCLLADHEEKIVPLTSAIDYLLAGMVLVDHAADWMDDLAAGRYNAFVHSISSHAQTPEHQEINRRRVMEEIFLGDAGRPYLELARRSVQRAIRLATTFSVTCAGSRGRWSPRERAWPTRRAWRCARRPKRSLAAPMPSGQSDESDSGTSLHPARPLRWRRRERPLRERPAHPTSRSSFTPR